MSQSYFNPFSLSVLHRLPPSSYVPISPSLNKTDNLAELHQELTQLRQQVSQQALLNQIVQAMQDTLVLDDILQRTVNQLHIALEVNRCLIFRPDPDNQMVAHHVSEATAEGQSLIGIYCDFYRYYRPILSTGKPIVLSEIDQKLPPEIQTAAQICGIRAILIVPLLYQQSYIGGISLIQCDAERKWMRNEIAFVQAVTDHCAIAIHQGELHQQLQIQLQERQQAEEQIKIALREKEILLQEIHHRVKNNLQIISSLLDLQSMQIQDRDTLELFRESQNRIKAMALIHQELYQSENLSRVNFSDYIENLSHQLIATYAFNPGDIILQLNLDKVSLNLDTAIPCGLIINELIANALKHGCSINTKARIWLELKLDNNQMILVVGNDAINSCQPLDLSTKKSLGLQLVKALVEQLEGEIEIEQNCGTVFKIKIKFTPNEQLGIIV
ncbi:MAG TPA: hypothetical protein DCL61_12960 [Cyanobacteria bacterium UBA12227]|nr:hypothetical protein [Cyanobacteria bacterium UBA12227]HAX89899.1 hypothetical protein [Cyanobacteria bacterium UBA11370]HBY81659.1 hypothetical protein [Cyanobacteria bacterium UBA11148]